MNKVEQLHLDAIKWEESSDIAQNGAYVEFVANDDYYDLAVKSAEITQQIAVEFADFYVSYCNKHGQTHSEEVFEEYLKTKQ